MNGWGREQMATATMMTSKEVGHDLVRVHRELFNSEARLAEILARRGTRITHSIVDQWPVLEEFLNVYGTHVTPAGVLVLGGAPDEASALTGIPFTGPDEARTHLGLTTPARGSSLAAGRFWRALLAAQHEADGAPFDSLLSSACFAHAVPLSAGEWVPEMLELSAAHVRHLLRLTRPQAVVTIGAEALAVLGHALGNENVEDLARTPEDTWTAQWPPGTRLLAYPSAESRDVRFRIVPLPSLTGESAAETAESLTHVLSYVWG